MDLFVGAKNLSLKKSKLLKGAVTGLSHVTVIVDIYRK